MKLAHITVETCPWCKTTDVIIEERNSTHTNGERFETRTFACGYKIAWVPNYSRLQVVEPCKTDPSEIDKKKKRLVLIDQIREVVLHSAADEYFKGIIIQYLPRTDHHS